MKNLILLIALLTSLAGYSQCVTPSNLGTQTTVDGSQLYLYWNTAGATEYKFIPLNFNALWAGQAVATWYGSGWYIGGVDIDTTGLCNTVIQWQIENYCFIPVPPPLGSETSDTTNADKSFSAVQSYFVSCAIPVSPIVTVDIGGHKGHVNVNGHGH